VTVSAALPMLSAMEWSVAGLPLHPLVVLVALMAGAELLGPSGAVLSVPIAATRNSKTP